MVWIIAIATLVIGGELWRMGGDGQVWARAVAFPALVATSKLLILATVFPWLWSNLYVLLYAPALWAMIAGFSYGVSAPPHKFIVWLFGAFLGKQPGGEWWIKASGGNNRAVEVTTRAVCGFFWSLPGAIFAFVTGEWIMFSIYVVFLTIANGLIGGLVKDVEISEKGVGLCVATSVII